MKILIYILLSPFTLLYWIGISLRNKLFDIGILRSEEFKVPVICVGNISAGGTGKTPHVEYLIENLKSEFRPAVLSRGYKRKTTGFVLAGEDPDPVQVGDEPCQMKRKFPELIVAVDEKRARGIKKLLELPSPPDVILLDDAFQHRYVKAGVNILLMDFNKPANKDFLLPGGRLREPLSAVKRAQIILITKAPKRMKAIEMRLIAREMKMHEFQHMYFTSINQEEIKPVFERDKGNAQFAFPVDEPEILLVTGIANPRQVKPFARKYSTRIREMKFPDHHFYSSDDIKNILAELDKMAENSVILTTEKDSVKLRMLEKEFGSYINRVFYLPISVEFLNNDENNFRNQILSYVRDNKRDSILHKGKV